MVTSFPLCLGRHNGEVTSGGIRQTPRVPRQSRGLTSIELVNITENTLRDYFQLYVDGGVARLKEVAIQGPESALQEHYASLETYFRAHPPATIKEAQNKIEALTGIKRSETQGREFLKKSSISAVAAWGCSRPKPTPTPKRATWWRSWSRA